MGGAVGSKRQAEKFVNEKYAKKKETLVNHLSDWSFLGDKILIGAPLYQAACRPTTYDLLPWNIKEYEILISSKL